MDEILNNGLFQLPVWMIAFIMTANTAKSILGWWTQQSKTTEQVVKAGSEDAKRNDAMNQALVDVIKTISASTVASVDAQQQSNKLHEYVIKLLEDKVITPLAAIDKRTVKIDKTTTSTQSRLMAKLTEVIVGLAAVASELQLQNGTLQKEHLNAMYQRRYIVKQQGEQFDAIIKLLNTKST